MIHTNMFTRLVRVQGVDLIHRATVTLNMRKLVISLSVHHSNIIQVSDYLHGAGVCP